MFLQATNPLLLLADAAFAAPSFVLMLLLLPTGCLWHQG
jgi:hypothetical protein